MKLTEDQLDRLEREAQKQSGTALGTLIRVMPGELMELCRLARIGVAAMATTPERQLHQDDGA